MATAGLATDSLALARAACRRILAACPAERIWLYGSRARGDHHSDSDLDLLVVVPDGTDLRAARSHAREAAHAAEFPVRLDVRVVDHGDFHERVHLAATYPGTIAREGRILYQEVDTGAKEAEEWLRQAHELLDTATRALDDPPRPTAAVVNLRRALELNAKAVLVAHDVRFRWTHDLADLGERIAATEPDLGARLISLREWDEWAQGLRYPGTSEAPEADEARARLEELGGLARDLDARARTVGRERESESRRLRGDDAG